ncbi:MAG: energy-coupling factor transporter transmembrane component T family protein [Anaerolineae bacterium]|jgi:energy-coupling factor transport system permease protein
MAYDDALRHVTIGQYIPTGSAIHRLDPRAKLLAALILGFAIILAASYSSNIALLTLVLALVGLSRLPLRYIVSGVRPALPIIIVLALMQLLFYGAGPNPASRVLLAWGPIRISTEGVRLVVVSLLRFAELLFLTSLLTNTTTTGDLTYGMESLMRPLNAVGLPGHELAMVGAIALRFLPILGEQLESILQAQASRGVRQSAAGRWQILENARRMARMIIPLFVDAYRRSEEMILAMQARCYRGGRGRTHLVELKATFADYVTVSASVIVLALVIFAQRTALP